MSTNWSNDNSAEEALCLMEQWQGIELTQALSLVSGLFSLNDNFAAIRIVKELTPDIRVSFQSIRQHALNYLKSNVTNDNLELIMLQLVQALRYEDIVVRQNN